MDMLQGTLDLLVLRILLTKSRHGYEIAKRISMLSSDLFKVGQGSLYPSLHRLEKKGFVKAEWGVTDTGRKAKFYALTDAGRKQAEEEKRAWLEFSAAIDIIMREG